MREKLNKKKAAEAALRGKTVEEVEAEKKLEEENKKLALKKIAELEHVPEKEKPREKVITAHSLFVSIYMLSWLLVRSSNS